MSIDVNHTSGKISTADKDLKLDVVNQQPGDDFNVSAEMNRVVNVQDPINDQDAVTKKFLEERIANLGQVVDLLAPPSPDDISNETISILGTSSARITDFTQTDNSNTGLSAAPGSFVQYVKRDNDFQISTLTQVGPGNSETLEIVRNGNSTASVTFDDTVNNGTTTDTDTLIISNNVDYGTISGDPLGFNFVYDAIALGTNTVSEGWNTVKLTQGDAETNTVTWYSDQSDPGVPQVTNISITPNATQHIVYSSSVPHYTHQQQFDISFDVNRLSGDFYPATDNFFDSAPVPQVGSGLRAISDIDYTTAGLPTPLPRNYLVSSGAATITTTANVQYGTGISQPNTGVTATIDNSYHTAPAEFLVADRILYMFDDFTSGTPVDETKIIVNNVGFGTGNGYRVETTSGDTPAESTTYTAWVGQTSTLNDYDATIVGGVAQHDQTDYSTGYLPVGPDLTANRSGAQYINFAFNRTATSKFKITYSGRVSGAWVRLPGTTIDNTSTLNGWMDATVPYEGIGVPGANTGAGGNGSNGCGLSSVFTTAQVFNQSVNVTFGTESSSNATNNTIVVRFKLEVGDNITNIKFETAD